MQLSKEIILNSLIWGGAYIGIAVYVVVFLYACYLSVIYRRSKRKNSDSKEDDAIGCVVGMIIIPVLIACYFWYQLLPDKLMR